MHQCSPLQGNCYQVNFHLGKWLQVSQPRYRQCQRDNFHQRKYLFRQRAKYLFSLPTQVSRSLIHLQASLSRSQLDSLPLIPKPPCLNNSLNNRLAQYLSDHRRQSLSSR